MTGVQTCALPIWLHRQGWTNTWHLDFSEEAIQGTKARYPELPEDKLLVEDVFKHEALYDYVLEQTLYCAINPRMRGRYVEKLSELLMPGGHLVGVLFTFAFNEMKGPPWGGSPHDYRLMLHPYFTIHTLQKNKYAVAERQGKELFVHAQKPATPPVPAASLG